MSVVLSRGLWRVLQRDGREESGSTVSGQTGGVKGGRARVDTVDGVYMSLMSSVRHEADDFFEARQKQPGVQTRMYQEARLLISGFVLQQEPLTTTKD